MQVTLYNSCLRHVDMHLPLRLGQGNLSRDAILLVISQASMANIQPKSSLVAVHMISAWVMTLFVLWVSLLIAACCSSFDADQGTQCVATSICVARSCMSKMHLHSPPVSAQMLWRYAKKSVALRIRYLITLPKGSDSNTVLVQDIPGVEFGTQAVRAKSVAPAFIANKVCRCPAADASCTSCMMLCGLDSTMVSEHRLTDTSAPLQIEAGIQKSTAAALKAAETAGNRTISLAGCAGMSASRSLCKT